MLHLMHQKLLLGSCTTFTVFFIVLCKWNGRSWVLAVSCVSTDKKTTKRVAGAHKHNDKKKFLLINYCLFYFNVAHWVYVRSSSFFNDRHYIKSSVRMWGCQPTCRFPVTCGEPGSIAGLLNVYSKLNVVQFPASKYLCVVFFLSVDPALDIQNVI